MTKRSDDGGAVNRPDEGPEHPEEVYAKKQFSLLQYRLQQLPDATRARLQGSFAQRFMDDTVSVATRRGPLSFVLLGKTSAGRATSLLTKQPATIEWIDAFQPDSVFWDVGANVGAYTMYAALRGDTSVVAFEPAAVNYFLLSANCEANRLDDKVTCLLLGVGADKSIARIEVSQFKPARSFSFRGKKDEPQPGRQAAMILSMDQLVEDYALPCPNYIKIDAPGLSEAVIMGGARILRRPDVREVHLEVNEETAGGPRLVEMLKNQGFVITSRHAHGGSADVTFARPGA